MRLITHNYLISTVRGVENGYPLLIQNVTSVEHDETEFRELMLVTLLSKLDLGTVLGAWEQLEPYCVGKESVLDGAKDNNSIPLLVKLPSNENELRAVVGLPKAESLKGHEGNKPTEECECDGDADKIDAPQSNSSEVSTEQRIETLKTLHTILLDLHVMEGELKCPGTGRTFPVKGGIPNMILHADEI